MEETYEPTHKRQRTDKSPQESNYSENQEETQESDHSYYQNSGEQENTYQHSNGNEQRQIHIKQQPKHTSYSPEESTAQILSLIGSSDTTPQTKKEPESESNQEDSNTHLSASQEPDSLSSSMSSSQGHSIHSLTNTSSPSGGPSSPGNDNGNQSEMSNSSNSSNYYGSSLLPPDTSLPQTLPVPQFPPSNSSENYSSTSGSMSHNLSSFSYSSGSSGSSGFYNFFPQQSIHHSLENQQNSHQQSDNMSMDHSSLHFFAQQQQQQLQHFQNQQIFQQHHIQQQQQQQQHHHQGSGGLQDSLSSQMEGYNSTAMIPLPINESPGRTKTVSKKKRDLSKEVQEKMDKLFEEAKKHKKRKALYSHLTIEPTPEPITVEGETKYRCTLCKKIYGRKDSCRKHISSELWEYPCSFCGIISATAQACMYHVMAKHLHMQVFDCPFCDKRFATHYALSNHQERTHSSSSSSGSSSSGSSSSNSVGSIGSGTMVPVSIPSGLLTSTSSGSTSTSSNSDSTQLPALLPPTSSLTGGNLLPPPPQHHQHQHQQQQQQQQQQQSLSPITGTTATTSSLAQSTTSTTTSQMTNSPTTNSLPLLSNQSTAATSN